MASATTRPGSGFRKEEGLGLVIAIALHVAVLAALLFTPSRREVVTPPQRIEVTIADEAAETSTSPDPFSQAAADSGPELGEPAPAPEPEPAPAPPIIEPAPRAIEPPPSAPRPAPKAPAPKAPAPKAPAPKPVAKAPAPKPPAPPQRRTANPIDRIVSRTPSKSPPAKSPPSKSPPSKSPPSKATGKAGAPASKSAAAPKKAGSSSFADAFKDGTPGASSTSRDNGKPASAYSTTERASFAGTLLRQVKPKWQGRVPEGVGTDKLVTVLSIELNRDGSLARRPTVVRQEGIDDSNRAQAARHAEEAVRAVELAAPFSLPPDSYEGWKKLPPLRFKKAL